MSVMVLDKKKKPLMPCSEKRARLLLQRKKAVVHRIGGDRQSVRVKIDPGSKFTGFAVVRKKESVALNTGEVKQEAHVLKLAELQHRGAAIRDALLQRKQYRRRRRGTNLRYRAPRFLNRGNKAKGYLAPSLQHRVNTTMAWVSRLRNLMPVQSISVERVKFDTQKMVTPNISGIAYQQGTLYGYEVREYLLEKWGRKCAYCDVNDKPLQIDHIQAKTNGGTDAVSNLTLACAACNTNKGAIDIRLFLASKPERLKKILAFSQQPLLDAAAVNATRQALYRRLLATGLAVEAATGGNGYSYQPMGKAGMPLASAPIPPRPEGRGISAEF